LAGVRPGGIDARAGEDPPRAGVALNTSEFDTTGSEIEYGARLARALAAAGYGNKHLMINTVGDGQGS
jgi:hypothetical protein